jgi:hypothetical protein
MMHRTALKLALSGAMAVLALAFPASPIGGIGIQYGYDASLSLPDKIGEQADFTDLSLNSSSFDGEAPTGVLPTITGRDLPVFINRTGFTRSPFDVGAKIFVDCIPVIDALELSSNFGMWSYVGQVIYPTAITWNGATAASKNVESAASGTPASAYSSYLDQYAQIKYDTANITMKNLGLTNPFVQNTPYAKLQFDLTARKYLLKLPPVANNFRVYGGAGVSLFYATPLLSAGFIEKAIGSTLSSVNTLSALSTQAFNDPAVEKEIAQEFLKELFTSHWGAHLDLGAMVKFPVMPFGIYVDGKYLFPFGSMDPNVTALKSNGLLINGGIAFIL